MLQRVHIHNFRCIYEAHIDLGHVNWCVGDNGTGKSSIAAAIEYALTGSDEWDDAKAQVRHGAKAGSVGVELGTGLEFTRDLPVHKGIRQLDQVVEQDVASRPLLRALLRARHFCALAPKEQTALLDGIFGASQSTDDIAAALAGNPESPGLPDLYRQHAKRAAVAKSAHQHFYDLRTAENRSLKDLEARIAATEQQTEATEPDAAVIASLEKRIAAERKRIADYEAEARAAVRVFEEQQRSWEARCEERTAAQVQVTRLEGEAKEIAVMAVGAKDRGRAPNEIASAITLAELDLKEATARLGEQGAAHNIEEECPPGVCLRARERELIQAEREAQAAVGAARERLHRLEKECAEAERVAAAQDALDKNHASVQRRLAEAKQRLQEIGNPEPPKRPPEPEARQAHVIDPIRVQGVDLEGRLREARQRACARAVWEASRRELDGLREQAVAQRQTCGALNAMVKAFEPGGAASPQGTQRAAEMAKKAQELAEHWFSADLVFKDGAWWAAFGPAQAMPVANLCWSEKARVSACIQVALALAARVPLVIIDEHALSPTNRGDLLEMLLAQDVQSIVLSMAIEMDDAGMLLEPEHPGYDGLRLFWLEAGAVREIFAAANVI